MQWKPVLLLEFMSKHPTRTTNLCSKVNRYMEGKHLLVHLLIITPSHWKCALTINSAVHNQHWFIKYRTFNIELNKRNNKEEDVTAAATSTSLFFLQSLLCQNQCLTPDPFLKLEPRSQ